MKLQILPPKKAAERAEQRVKDWERKMEIEGKKESSDARKPEHSQKKKLKTKSKPKDLEQEKLNNELRKVARGKEEDVEKARELIEQGADVNSTVKRPTGSFQRSALAQAVYYGHLKMAMFLVENGADVNIKDAQGNTPSMIAVRRRNVEMIKLLLEKGARVDCKNQDGFSVFSFYVGRKDIRELLKKAAKK